MRFSLPRAPTLKMKFLMVIVAMLSLYTFFSYIVLEVWYLWMKRNPKHPALLLELPYVIVHIDLKGTPLKLSYLESLLPVLKSYGANGLLMEYEDMFPYEGRLANLSAENCYKKSELKKFLSSAADAGLEVIPLVQTFGHLEYVLKLQDFKHLREQPEYPDSICPSKLESEVFLKDLLKQIFTFHNDIAPVKYIHIGCDEVFHINKCQHCKKRNHTNNNLFLHHINTVSILLKALAKDTDVLIWDDMLRGIKPGQWHNIGYLTNVQVVCWDYGTSLQVSNLNLYKFHKQFRHIWIASAYKGADGRTATLTNSKNRFSNNFSWLNFILGYTFGGDHKVFSFKGIILTGWSRYSHMDPPCELLPASMPSLILNLLTIKKFKAGVTDLVDYEDNIEERIFFKKYLNTELKRNINCELDSEHFDNPNCIFDGKDLYDILQQYVQLNDDINFSLNDENSALGSVEYYANLKSINMNLVQEYIDQCSKYIDKIIDIEYRMINEISKYYDLEFVTEYVNFKVMKHKNKMQSLITTLKGYNKIQTWKRGGIFNISIT